MVSVTAAQTKTLGGYIQNKFYIWKKKSGRETTCIIWNSTIHEGHICFLQTGDHEIWKDSWRDLRDTKI